MLKKFDTRCVKLRSVDIFESSDLVDEIPDDDFALTLLPMPTPTLLLLLLPISIRSDVVALMQLGNFNGLLDGLLLLLLLQFDLFATTISAALPIFIADDPGTAAAVSLAGDAVDDDDNVQFAVENLPELLLLLCLLLQLLLS